MSPATARKDNRAATSSRGLLGTHTLTTRREGPGGVKRVTEWATKGQGRGVRGKQTGGFP